MVIVPPENQGRRRDGQRLAPGQECAGTGGIAEHLVEGERDEVGLHLGEVKPVGRGESRRVQQDLPAFCPRQGDPLERMLHTAEVRLRRIGEEPGVSPGRGLQVMAHQTLVQAQIGVAHRHVDDLRAVSPRILTNAVDGVVIVVGKQIGSTRFERERLSDELQRPAGVRGEDHVVLVRGGMEEVEHGRPCLLDELRWRPARSGCASADCRRPRVARRSW